MLARTITVWIFINLMAANVLAAEQTQDYKMFNDIFSKWTQAFNEKNLAQSCDLFAKNMLALYQGAAPKTYDSICDSFKKIFNENRNYHYSYKLHRVYRDHHLAAARITWFLRITENDKLISEITDEGLDIFQQNAQGEWKIIEYLGYPAPDVAPHLIA